MQSLQPAGKYYDKVDKYAPSNLKPLRRAPNTLPPTMSGPMPLQPPANAYSPPYYHQPQHHPQAPVVYSQPPMPYMLPPYQYSPYAAPPYYDRKRYNPLSPPQYNYYEDHSMNTTPSPPVMTSQLPYPHQSPQEPAMSTQEYADRMIAVEALLCLQRGTA
eukprot:Awhi_evm2s10929